MFLWDEETPCKEPPLIAPWNHRTDEAHASDKAKIDEIPSAQGTFDHLYRATFDNRWLVLSKYMVHTV